MGKSLGTSGQRHEANIAALRRLVDAGSPSVVRHGMAGGDIINKRRRFPVPSIGYRSGKLTVTGYLRGTRGGFAALIVKCECTDREYTVDTSNFKDFKSTRCNICAKTAASKKRYWAYAEAMPDDNHRTRLLNRLASAISRCHVPTCKYYIHYGARGIFVHKGWRDDRASFLIYVQTLPGWDTPEYEMDRVDVNGGYEPGNIRFVTRSTNLLNKRRIADLEAEIARLRLSQRGSEA